MKSILYGFSLGAILFVIAPLGLGITLIEILKPALVPGVLITQLIFGNSAGVIPVISALALNGLVFTLLFLSYFLFRMKTGP